MGFWSNVSHLTNLSCHVFGITFTRQKKEKKKSRCSVDNPQTARAVHYTVLFFNPGGIPNILGHQSPAALGINVPLALTWLFFSLMRSGGASGGAVWRNKLYYSLAQKWWREGQGRASINFSAAGRLVDILCSGLVAINGIISFLPPPSLNEVDGSVWTCCKLGFCVCVFSTFWGGVFVVVVFLFFFISDVFRFCQFLQDYLSPKAHHFVCTIACLYVSVCS